MNNQQRIADTEIAETLSALTRSARVCPFCGEYPDFTIEIKPLGESLIHLAKRDGCCRATKLGQTELFFSDKKKIDSWLSMAQRLINDWNRRDE